VLPDVVHDAVAPVLPDASPDAVFAFPDATAFLDAASALPDAPRDGFPMVPDVPPDFSSALPDASNEVQLPLPDAGAFCSGDTSHMVVNGIESYPLVSGGLIPLDCCEGGVFHITTDTFASLISVTWRTTKQVPATVDLTSLPTVWGVRVEIGCDPMSAACISAPATSEWHAGASVSAATASGGGGGTTNGLHLAWGAKYPAVVAIASIEC